MKMISKYGLFILLVLTFHSCQRDIEEDLYADESLNLKIRWNASWENESIEDGLTSLKWSLSFLGARLPDQDFNQAVKLEGQNKILLNFNKMGFEDYAIRSFEELIPIIKSSEEYEKNDGIDLGRFIMLTLNSAHHYYAITGAKKTMKDFLESHDFKLKEAAIIESSISFGNRLIKVPDAASIVDVAFIAQEGTGKIGDGNFEIKEYEVMDIMPNGQNRFAIYDEFGDLITAGDTNYSLSGKASKCLWCHETFVQPAFSATAALDGYIGPVQFNDLVSTLNTDLDNYRDKLNTSLNFSQQQDHELLEITYISFMEPSARRLAMEWNMTKDEVSKMLSSYPTHVHHEFSFLGDLYHRSDIESFSPYKTLEVPESAREFSYFEPRYISSP